MTGIAEGLVAAREVLVLENQQKNSGRRSLAAVTEVHNGAPLERCAGTRFD